MPIVEFENRNEAPLTLAIEPWGERHEIPHLARAGIRYAVREGAEDRSFSSLRDLEIEFWCNADSYEIEIVPPSPAERLLWDICVIGGWCGGIVDGEPTRVDDLLPASGKVTAEEFARLTVRAEGWPADEPPKEDHLCWLKQKFVERLGATSVDVEVLRRISPKPFESGAS